MMLASRRVTVSMPVRTRISGLLAMLAMIVVLVGVLVLGTWPARPRTWIGWLLALLVGVPVLVLGEFAGEALRKRAPADPARRVSIRRIAWLLAVLLAFGGMGFLALRLQTQILGDPLGALSQSIAPHYH